VDGAPLHSRWNGPTGVVCDGEGNIVVADTLNSRIRFIDRSGQVSTLAGNGKKNNVDGDRLRASFELPTGVVIDRSGSVIVTCNRAVRKIDARTGEVSTLAGGSLLQADGVAVDGLGNILVADRGSDRIFQIDESGSVSPLIVKGGPNELSPFRYPRALAVDRAGNLLVCDDGHSRVCRLTFVEDDDRSQVAATSSSADAKAQGHETSGAVPSGGSTQTNSSAAGFLNRITSTRLRDAASSGVWGGLVSWTMASAASAFISNWVVERPLSLRGHALAFCAGTVAAAVHSYYRGEDLISLSGEGEIESIGILPSSGVNPATLGVAASIVALSTAKFI